ncbi:MAG: hypothetical protein UHM85_08355, partial [Acutalibacteraceae bacterium]|nr:hypothetical protein [Acutalibacteraceae bacterium]
MFKYIFRSFAKAITKVNRRKVQVLTMENIPVLQKEHTLKLLRECDAGVKTAMNSIREVLGNINS